MSPTVLLVDDASTCRELIATALGRAGYRVVSAEDGRRAIELLEDHSPDVVLLDLALPRMDGLDLLRTIRQMRQWRDLPVVLFTGSGNALRLTDGLGVEECLVKSVASVAEIRNAIGRAIRKLAAAV